MRQARPARDGPERNIQFDPAITLVSKFCHGIGGAAVEMQE